MPRTLTPAESRAALYYLATGGQADLARLVAAFRPRPAPGKRGLSKAERIALIRFHANGGTVTRYPTGRTTIAPR